MDSFSPMAKSPFYNNNSHYNNNSNNSFICDFTKLSPMFK